MMLPYFASRFLVALRTGADENLARYGPDAAWIEGLANQMLGVKQSGRVVDPPPALIVTERDTGQNDAANAKLIHSWLVQLPPVVAMDERLWACLAHTTFATYMHARWPVTGASVVRRRYFFEGSSFAALSRHGIARLWWAGHLTKDPARENPFELTETLFLRQDIQVALLERSLGKCGHVRAAVLEFIRDNQGWFGDASFGRRVQVLVREVNLLGGVALLDTLPGSTLADFVDRTARALVDAGESDSK